MSVYHCYSLKDNGMNTQKELQTHLSNSKDKKEAFQLRQKERKRKAETQTDRQTELGV